MKLADCEGKTNYILSRNGNMNGIFKLNYFCINHFSIADIICNKIGGTLALSNDID